jgi:phage shock protein A
VATAEDRVTILEGRVNVLETWAGPGQIEVLVAGLAEVRTNVRAVIKTQERHTRQLADLTSDVSGLKTDMAEVKADVAELKTDVAQLKTDVAELKTGMAELRATVGDLATTLKMVVDHLGITGAPVG